MSLSEDTKKLAFRAIALQPGGIDEPPATEAELASFEQEFGTIPDDYRWFLSTCGSGCVGAEYLDGIQALRESHRKFRAEFGPPRGWSMEDVFIIGWDGGGNPFGIHRTTGQVLVEDHHFGGIHEMAPSLDAFLAEGLEGAIELYEEILREPSHRHRPELPEDCEAEGKPHQWHNIDNESSGCYNCNIVKQGQLWRRN